MTGEVFASWSCFSHFISVINLVLSRMFHLVITDHAVPLSLFENLSFLSLSLKFFYLPFGFWVMSEAHKALSLV
jgi:hypothetical protein